jgi:transcriptional regulator with XRE-family HTH domain
LIGYNFVPIPMPKSLRSPSQKRLEELLIRTRQTRKLTQWDIASKLGRPQSFVSKYESGERLLDVIEFIDVARALGADPVALLADLLKR